MGRIPSGRRKYQIKHIQERHREIIRLLVLGYSGVAIAGMLDITPVTVSNVKNSALVQGRIAELQRKRDEVTIDIAKTCKDASSDAAAILLDTMRNPNTETKLKVSIAKDVLDRAGFGAPQKVQGAIVHGLLTGADLENIKQRAREAGILVEVGAPQGAEEEQA